MDTRVIDVQVRFGSPSFRRMQWQATYLLELWEDLMFLAEMMLRDSTPSAVMPSTSGLFLIRPGGTGSHVDERYSRDQANGLLGLHTEGEANKSIQLCVCVRRTTL